MHKVNYGTQDILFELKRSNRKTLAIEVHPDSSVIAIAPFSTKLALIKTKIIKRGQWILKQQTYFEQFLPRTPEREYISGETHLYLGKKYLLKIRKGENNYVKLQGGAFVVTCKNPNQKNIVKKLLAQWYYEHAEIQFKTISEKCFLKFKNQIKEMPPIEIRRMEKRWGSCNAKGKISINPEIIKAPTKCIEYLLIHEMCHLIIRNHTKAFYQLQEEKIPDWERWKSVLENKLS